MERMYELCWMCASRLDEPVIRFDIPLVAERHNVGLCRWCHGHPKRDQIARRLYSLEERLRKHETPESI